jgi:tRNA-Thr(GGU) m(6)t(6)A37 methyltransferase TsaA
MNKEAFTMSPIGHIRIGEDGFYLDIGQEYRPALQGLEGFSHLNVFWWCHLLDQARYRKILDCEQPYKKSPARLGIFATRSPVRPNPIALTAVAVQSIDYDRGVIQVYYIDAENGTPIMDLKPYHPVCDRIRDVTVPDWCGHWPKWMEDSATFDWSAEFVNAR